MKKLFSSFLLFPLLMLVTTVACAADSSTSITATAVTNHTDISVAYLAQVFGTVGNTLQGTTGQMLGQLFYKLNQGILVVAGLWLGYSVLTIVLKSAQEGSFMGANRNVAVILLKIALGLGLLVPNPTTGYSVFQDVVMKVVVEGVALADQTWRYGLTYVQNGGAVWRSPQTSVGGTKQVMQAASALYGTYKPGVEGSSISNAGPIQQIFQDEVCMIGSNNPDVQGLSSSSGSTNISNSGNTAKVYNVVTGTGNMSNYFEFPGVGNSTSLSGETPNCGSVNWMNVVSGKGESNSVSSTSTSSQYSSTAKQAVQQLIQTLMPAAKSYVCSETQGANNPSCSGVSTTNITANNQQIFFTALVDYLNAIYPIAQYAADQGQAKAADFIGQAEKDGWITAGRYYWDLTQVEAHVSTVSNLSSYAPSVTTPSSDFLKNSKLEDLYNNAATAAAGTYIGNNATSTKDSVGDAPSGSALQLLANYASSSSAGSSSGYNLAGHSSLNWVIGLLLGPIVSGIANLFYDFSSVGMGPDPILFLHNIGMQCVNIAGGIWFATAGTLFGVLSLVGICSSSQFEGQTAESIVAWLKPPLMTLSVGLLGGGLIFGYYVPLYPFMLFTFGVIGWLIAVIEAMVAAPLVCFGLTHPEGHDFLGETKQALMLLLGVFLRPTLMVIGMIAGMVLAYVSLELLVYTYSGFVRDLFYTHAPMAGTVTSSGVEAAAAVGMGHIMAQAGSVDGLILDLMAFPLFLVIFAMLVYVVTNQCYSLIYVLPDNIMRWIGGPQSPSTAAQMAAEVKGGISSAGQSGGQLAQGLYSSYDSKRTESTDAEVSPDEAGDESGDDEGSKES